MERSAFELQHNTLDSVWYLVVTLNGTVVMNRYDAGVELKYLYFSPRAGRC